MLLALPLPYLAYRLLREQKATSMVMLPHLSQTVVEQDKSTNVAKTLAIIAWILFVLASARPVWYDDPVEIHPKHRDVMLVIDLSNSMSQEDMQQGSDYIDRLSAVKNVVSDFIDKRTGDRLGLVYFADHAYLQTPLTFDRETVKAQLNQTVLKLIGTQTAIGDGIGLATKTFIDSDAPQRVMILLSDGSNNAGVMDPIQAATIAKKFHTTIYTIGVGAGKMQVQNFFMTRTVNTAQDLDEETLTKVATMTGGQYFRARNAQDLESIYSTINSLQPIQKATQSWRPRTEWFVWPALFGLIFVVITVVIRRNNV
nr:MULTISPECIES: VWA domain-containing protein [unclassified Vibrio]